jgi:hypothetical protein
MITNYKVKGIPHGSEFIFRDIKYNSGDKVMVSGHYACYKSQYNFMIGTVYLNELGIPCVKLEINQNDIQQNNGIELDCYENINKL